MQQAMIAPTEVGYDVNDVKRATLTFDKVFLLEPGDRDLFPGSAFGMAMGMPPIMSTLTNSVRPLGKSNDYEDKFQVLVDECKPLIDAGVVEVTSCWGRAETERGLTIGMVPLGGYPLNVEAVLRVYRGIARNNDFLLSGVDLTAVDFAKSDDVAAFTLNGQADGSINNDPALPELVGDLQSEELRPALTIIARARIATALKVWGVAEQRGLVPILPHTSAAVMDRLANSARATLDATEQDPYWTRRAAILDVVMGEFLSDERLNSLSPTELLQYRTSAMRRSAEARTALFSELREMAEEPTNLDLAGFRDRIQDRLNSYVRDLAELNEERKAIRWQIKLALGQSAAGTAGGALLGNGVFHLGMPFSLSASALLALAWALEQAKEYAPAVRQALADERALKGSNEYAVFRHFNYLVPMDSEQAG